MLGALGGGALPLGGPGTLPGPAGLTPPTPPPDFGDPVLLAMEAAAPLPSLDPWAEIPKEKRRGYMPKLDPAVWREIVNHDEQYYRRLIRRFSRDLMLYRQRWSARPPGFDPKREVAFQTATLSNLVNKLTAMSAPMDHRYELPYKDEQSKHASQVLENALSYWRQCQEFAYAESGGHSSLQWDEFFSLYLYGRIYKRILPYPQREHFPFHVTLLDPSTVFPVWGGDTEGLVRVSIRKQMSAIDILSTYLPYEPTLEARMRTELAKKAGFDADSRSFYHLEKEYIEGWDTWRRWASWGDVTIMEEEHELGYVPFVCVTARGEPRGFTTPLGRYYDPDTWQENTDGDGYVYGSNTREDLAEKGVSVFHHIVNSNRMLEVVYTLLTTEILKASNPATITYAAGHLANKSPYPFDFKPGGNNQRTLNAHKVEIAPTSPRPTDTSPVMQRLTQDMTEGGLNPATYGAIEGSNIAGYAIESMGAAAKDTLLPYLHAWELSMQMQASMMIRQYRDQIMPHTIASVPMATRYGASQMADLTPEIIERAGDKVRVEIIGVSDQQLPMLANAAGSLVERGFWSRRKAMEKLGEKDPTRMIQDIIIERALEHPEMMENFLIPINFIRSGQKDLADLWVLMVVMPKIQMLMAKMLGPMAQGPMAGVQASGATGQPPGPPGGEPVGLQGMSNPMQGIPPGPPTGPQPGQGRGAAPAGIMG